MMNQRTDWFPGTRVTQLEMARNWQNVTGTSGSAWGIPPAVMQNFDVLTQAAANAKKGSFGPMVSALYTVRPKPEEGFYRWPEELQA
jgi:hypothetical protein